MNGREFLESANRLVATGHASDIRSAISRAYYAAFHAVRDFFSDCGIRFSEHSPEAHTKMPQCLDNSNVQVAIELGGQLRSLREDRNGADYRMSDLQYQNAANAQLRIKIAEGIIAMVDALATEPDRTNMRRLLRPKARQLGLEIVGLVLRQDLILGLSATGSASANDADVAICHALAEPVAPSFLALTEH